MDIATKFIWARRAQRAQRWDNAPEREGACDPTLVKSSVSSSVKCTLWAPEDSTGESASNRVSRPSERPRAPSSSTATRYYKPDPRELQMIKQPETRPITQDQLVAEVKGIYAGLVMVETKCIEVCSTIKAQKEPAEDRLSNEQWQALIALHRTLLHEHHDFFLASQHPSASPALRRLASKYAMPARMWRHGIHTFLELLRHRLPESSEHMLTFVYTAYSMMALLFETVPTFEDTWVECLGDLGRYRMAIEDDDIKDREIWTAVSREWYSKASQKAPTVGRLYHHLAILARPNAPMQLYFYIRALSIRKPFDSVRESIMTLFEPIMKLAPDNKSRPWAYGYCLADLYTHDLEDWRRWPISAKTVSSVTRILGASPFQHSGIHRICRLFLGASLLNLATAAPQIKETRDTAAESLAGQDATDTAFNLWWHLAVFLVSSLWGVAAYYLDSSEVWYGVAMAGWTLFYLFRTFGPLGSLQEAASVGLASMVFLALWLAKVTSAMDPQARRFAVFGTGAAGIILDMYISSHNPATVNVSQCTKVFGSDQCPDRIWFMTAILPPCLVLAAVISWGLGRLPYVLQGLPESGPPASEQQPVAGPSNSVSVE